MPASVPLRKGEFSQVSYTEIDAYELADSKSHNFFSDICAESDADERRASERATNLPVYLEQFIFKFI